LLVDMPTELVSVPLPRWGMDMQEGTIAQWLKHHGDRVSEGETLATVETDKVAAELKAPASGILEQIYVEAGGTVEVGTTVAVIRPDA
jgi:pyruvate/2-oxoglutarate dehydrogenase complex dihydrolipoamide acyltransferase (E2) component